MKILNAITSVIQSAGVTVTGGITSMVEPYVDFVRPSYPKVTPPPKLSDLATQFENDMQRFGLYSGAVYTYQINLDGTPAMGNQTIWHGVYTAMWALKYAVTQDPTTLEIVRKCMDGLKAHQWGSGESKARLIGGVYPNPTGKYTMPDGTVVTFSDDASNDDLSGHLLGIWAALTYCGTDTDINTKCAALIDGISTELINNKWCLINADGSTTTYGQLVNGALTGGLDLGICLLALKLAAKVGLRSNAVYENLYSCINAGPIVSRSKFKLLWVDDFNDTHRCAFINAVLASLETDSDKKSAYIAGTRWAWNQCKKSNNPWVFFWYETVEKCCNWPLYESIAELILREFTLEDKGPNVQKINSTNTTLLNTLKVSVTKWGSQLVSTQPLPRWCVGTQDFFWQRHPYSVDDYVGQLTPSVNFNGGDFLAAYWLGRHNNAISPTN